jgi:hypothetical protein
MPSMQNMVLGFIPQDWDINIEIISVGNPESSKTFEVPFRCSDKGFELPDEIIAIDQNLWDENSKFWKVIAKSISKHFKNTTPAINPKCLGLAYQIFNDEGDNYEGLELVAGSNDGGEFSNTNGKYNGKYYIYYDYEDEGEHFDEKILLIHS